MLKRENKLKIAIDFLSNNFLELDLSKLSVILSDEDAQDIVLFFDSYNNKYGIDLVRESSNTFILKKKNISITKIFTAICELTSRDFEKISAILTKVLNYKDYYATKETYDEGVDFFAEREDNDNLKTIEFIFGQCKKFDKNLVKVNEIRELAGSINLLKMKEFINTNTYTYITKKIKSHSAIKGVFVTSHFFSEPSETLCKNCGIVPIDILDLLYLFYKGFENNTLNWIARDNQFLKTNFLKDINEVKIAH
jgi:hypothetical protein